ncbi:MAG: thiamine pyrophosphate-dependent dehydrogenase E1 component subunit alpha, partial [Armatimonadota bacterium]
MPKDIDVLPDFEPGQIVISPIPKFVYRGNLADELARGMSPTDAVRMLRHMLEIRHFEERIVELKSGKCALLEGFKFVGATHLSIGQEAVAVGAISAIHPDDYITSTHRGHGHGIAKGAFWIERQDDDSLRRFIGDDVSATTREELLAEALQVHLHRTMAELLGKEDGYCRGRGGGMHIADFNMGHLGANAIVGGSYAMATGAAIACDKLRNGRIVLCFMGDGALSNGISHESHNMATMAQFKRGCPVIYLVENNQYGMTGQQVGEVTGVRYLAQRGAAYNDVNMNAEVVNGMDVLAVRDAVLRAAQKCRAGKGPVLLEALTYRYMGHSLSDNCTAYRSKQEEEAWKAHDAIERFTRQI